MNIRFAEEKDMNQIIELCRAHAIFEKSDYDDENKKEQLSKQLFQANDIVKCLVVEEEDELIGYATFMKQFSTWDADFYLYLDCLYLKEKSRGKGLGRMLMNEVRKYAKEENCIIIQWQTPDFNDSAIAFYNRIGAKSKAKERFFWEV